ncbi:hypothetical protein Aple_066240 [Acrocarpospora pleiomorpha]|uniref:CoA transferase n=1 Tax=Acrocarpospora pleiomorpha TaxID=90975 RepID=A0A5M3XQY1_9ACTN|nr:CoA transferase [Acrocarpospora pleiomorpha]GES23725.1 hypothetical protein Aple_066240 [Acrocarpospora pleiomorpha]
MTGPLRDIEVKASGPPALTTVAVRHLALLGAETTAHPGPDGPGIVTVGGRLSAEIGWAMAAPAEEVSDEATAQAATGVAHVHGRSTGTPRGLAVDYLTTACGVLAVQGVLAGLIGRARGAAVERLSTGVDLAGLLSVSQYLAAATADDEEGVAYAPGGPPFTTKDGVRFEVETLDAEVWAAFWHTLGAPDRLAASAWRSFQFRYATASSPLPDELHLLARSTDWYAIGQAAKESGASLCALRSLADRLHEPRPDAPWELSPTLPAGDLARSTAEIGRPLAGFTVLEAGRRIQAPLAAHLLGLLGADVVRIEPPGGDPLRGMPPTCGDLSARWLALNRGKSAVEIDIKSAAGRDELRDLAAGADVFVHNWAPGTAERLGLNDLSAVSPGLVYAYTSGWAGRLPGAPLGTDFMVQARTAVGEAVRPAGEPPAPALMTLLDVLGGLLGAEAVLAGLLLRERDGRGVRVDSSLLGAAETLTEPALRRLAHGLDPRMPTGFRHPCPTGDGWVAVADGCPDPGPLTGMTTAEAVETLRARGSRATAVTTDLTELPSDERFASVLTRDEHGAIAVPSPWRFA